MGHFKRTLPWLAMAAIVGFIAWKLHSSHFDWAGFGRSLKTADLRLIGLAVLVVYCQNLLRAMRWSVFLRPTLRQSGKQRIHWWNLAGSQFVGFAGLAIFGRIGELIRPLLVSRRTGLTFSSQIAVVTVERVFDLGVFGAIFALTLLLSPTLRSLPYLGKAGYTIGALTIAVGVFVAAVRLAGELMARMAGGFLGLASKSAGAAVAEKILSFRDGLNVIDSARDFALAVFLSVSLWFIIILSYVLVLKAFPSPVHDLTVGHVVVLMGFSIAGSALPIPGGGGAWAGMVLALTQLFQVPQELAASAGLILWLITNMSVIPIGLVFAKIEGVSLAQIARRSEAAEEATA